MTSDTKDTNTTPAEHQPAQAESEAVAEAPVDEHEGAQPQPQENSDGAEALAAESAAQAPAESGPHLTVVPVEPLSAEHIRNVLEAALFAADEALTVDRLVKLFVPGELAEEGGRAQVREALGELEAASEDRGFELKKVASGYRMQVRQNLSPWVSRLWEEKPPRYTRALLETMALIAYKQPATRGDIEEVRGVAVSSNIMRTLLERGWIREVGQRDVPGRPSMYGTTKEFLDYFNLSSLDQLPSLPEIRELVEPAPIEPAPVAADAPDASDYTEEKAEETADVVAGAEQEEVDQQEAGQGDTLAGVDMPERTTDSSSTESTGTAPVFADSEVVVVSESASGEVQRSSELSSLPSAERQE